MSIPPLTASASPNRIGSIGGWIPSRVCLDFTKRIIEVSNNQIKQNRLEDQRKLQSFKNILNVLKFCFLYHVSRANRVLDNVSWTYVAPTFTAQMPKNHTGINVMCVICQEDFNTNPSIKSFCPTGHFLHDTCHDQYIDHSIAQATLLAPRERIARLKYNREIPGGVYYKVSAQTKILPKCPSCQVTPPEGQLIPQVWDQRQGAFCPTQVTWIDHQPGNRIQVALTRFAEQEGILAGELPDRSIVYLSAHDAVSRVPADRTLKVGGRNPDRMDVKIDNVAVSPDGYLELSCSDPHLL